ncbi:MAG: hypothetical protein KJ927_15215, partial [Candidatus Eisenbacteria bacterium]|nr:hypothetical protein [Candidatus Eisenbacteria bacterium]
GGKRPAPPDEESGAWALLLDTYDPDRAGGTGRPFPWEWIEGWSRQRRIILSGGLGPDNVGPAIHAVQPQGVDASSRLERGQGRKDLDAVRAYIEKARHAFNELGGRPSGK